MFMNFFQLCFILNQSVNLNHIEYFSSGYNIWSQNVLLFNDHLVIHTIHEALNLLERGVNKLQQCFHNNPSFLNCYIFAQPPSIGSPFRN